MEQKIGIVGLGHIAKKHIEVIKKLLPGRIYGYDIQKGKIHLFEEQYDIIGCYSLEELIDISDIIAICTPHDTHMEILKRVEEKGKICLCEKPLCIFPQEYASFQNIYPKDCYVMLQNRYNLAVEQAKKIIDAGNLGKIYYMKGYTKWNRDDSYYSENDWKGKKQKEGGMLYNQAIHNLDTALWLNKQVWKSIDDIHILHATKKRFRELEIETEDFFSADMQIADIFFEYSILTYGDREHHENSLLIIGTNGSLKIGGKALNELQYVSILGKEQQEPIRESVSDIYGSGHYKIYQKLLAGDTNTLPSFCDGKISVELIAQLYKKAAL